jgi:hypothetical protein
VETRVETKTVFFIFAKSENEQIFAKNVRLRENLFLFSEKFSQKFFVCAKVFVEGKVCRENFTFQTPLLVHVHGYCLICFETLSGFDHRVGYLNNNTAVSFVLKQDPDL